MGDVGQDSGEKMEVSEENDQHTSQASGSGIVESEKIVIDGYSVVSGKPTVSSWPAFKSNTWRNRLKRVRNSLSANNGGQIDEPTTSLPEMRYAYTFALRFRCSSPEILPKIDSQNLLEIAGSTAQTFKDISSAIKKREEARSISRKGRKSSAPAPETVTVPTKQSAGKKRSKETEEPPKSKEKSRPKDREQRSDSSEKTKKTGKETPEPSKKKKKKEKKERSPTPADKGVNGGKFSLSTLSRGTPSPSEEANSATAEKLVETPTKEQVSSSVNIKGWSKEKIVEYFKLKEFTIDISDFPHHELQPSTSSQPAVEKPKEEKATEESVAESAEQRAVESGIAPDSEKDKENVEVKPEEKNNRKRKRSVSSSSSCSSASSSRHRSSDESDEERNSQAKTTVKKKAHSERPCVECGRWLDDCIMEWKEALGPSSVWCSRECIERRVARAHEVLPETYGALTLLRGDGQLLTTGPTLVNLAEFIYKYPEYEPVLPVAKKKSTAKNEQVADSKKSNPKILSKDSDRIRFNVRRAFSDALMKRAKMDKVKSAMKLCKDAAEGVEAALFKMCESNLNSPKYKGWTKTFIENVADCRNKAFYYRVLTGVISVHKVVTLDGDDMKKSEYSAPMEADGADEEKPNAKSEDVNSSASTSNNAKIEEKTQDMKEPSAKNEDSHASASQANLSRKTSAKKETPSKTTSSAQNKQDVKPAKRATRRSDSQKPAAVSTIDAILGDGAKDTTEQHLSHFYDVNCSICLAKQKSQAEAERKEREEKEKQREEDRRFREMIPLNRRPGYAPNESMMLDEPSSALASSRQSFDEYKRVQTPESTGAACASDEEYAGSYGGGGNESPGFGDTAIPFSEPRGFSEGWRDRRESNFMEPVRSGPSTTVWNGQISINNTMVMTSLCLVSNPIAYRVAPELPSVLRIKGRIVPVIVFDYVHGIVKNRQHHVCVLRLTAPVDYEGEQRFFSLYEDMIRKGRYFAIEVPHDSCFKDMYLMPLPPGEEPPAIFLPFDGPGIPPRHPPMIICVMVVYGSGRAWSPNLQKSFPRDALLGRSPQDPSVCHSRSSMPSRADSASPAECENIRSATSPEEEQAVPVKRELEEEVPASEKEVPEPESVQNDAASALDVEECPPCEPQSQSVASTPPDPAQVNFAPVCEADSLLPSKFFAMCKEAAKEPAKIPSAEEIDTLPDLLVYIQLNSNPREIKEVVARFMMNPTLSDNDRELIRRKVMEKISTEKKKKAQSRRPATPIGGDTTTAKEEPKEEKDKEPVNDSQESLNIDSIDLDSLNQLSSFVGEGVKDLLMQVGEELEPAVGPPPSPPPPPPPAPPLDEFQDLVKPDEETKKMKEEDQNALSCSEMLPGPPPVPPVYGDNDSSDSESPPDRESKNAGESPSLPLPPPFPNLNVVPLPPPPPIVSSHPDISVPPPPPPPPNISNDKVDTVEQSSTSEQPFIAPPPPPPVLTVPQSVPSTMPLQPGPQMPLPPPPGMFHPVPMPPMPSMMPPGFHPPAFMGAPPPPPVPAMMSGMPATPRGPYPQPGGMPPPPMHPSGMPPQGQPSGHPDERKEFIPTMQRPGFPHGPPPGFPQVPQPPPRMDIPQDQPSAIAGTLPANHGAAGFLGSAPRAVPQPPTTTSELAPLPSQIASTQVTPKRVLPTGIIPSLGRALTERDLIPRTPTPPPSPPPRRPPGSRNGPRTPSPDFLKKRDREGAFERLRNDVAVRRREIELQTRLDLEEMRFQAGKGPPRNAQRDGNASDSDAMEIDAGESEGEYGDFDDTVRDRPGRGPWSAAGRARGAPGPGMRGMPHGTPRGHRAMPPTPRGRGAFPVTPRGGPPQHPGRAAFMTPQPPRPSPSNRGSFFSPPMRGVRGAPNLRRGLPPVGRGGGGGPPPPRSGFPPPMRPFPGRGDFYGSQGGPRSGPPLRGAPPYRPRGMF
ncbi:SPOC domain protein [Ancylostoma caninum]|uniref:SPOC domain protein n=1 Tax=Ancylostoma caninum TaxID=29170 RepID=A0A368H148_ANCCA|nr:SPOC domain protein [Ancylostoma caninum]